MGIAIWTECSAITINMLLAIIDEADDLLIRTCIKAPKIKKHNIQKNAELA